MCVPLDGLVYWGLTPQQQPGSYQGIDDEGEMSVSLMEETGVPRVNHRPTARNVPLHHSRIQS